MESGQQKWGAAVPAWGPVLAGRPASARPPRPATARSPAAPPTLLPESLQGRGLLAGGGGWGVITASRLRFGSSLGALHAVAPIVGATGYVREERWLVPPGAGGGGAGTEVQCGAGAQTSGAGPGARPPHLKGVAGCGGGS